MQDGPQKVIEPRVPGERTVTAVVTKHEYSPEHRSCRKTSIGSRVGCTPVLTLHEPVERPENGEALAKLVRGDKESGDDGRITNKIGERTDNIGLKAMCGKCRFDLQQRRERCGSDFFAF